MFKKILVPMDTSKFSFRALAHAVDIAKAGRGKITVLSAIELSGSFSTSYMDGQEAFLRKEFAKLHKKAFAYAKRKKFSRINSELVLGKPADMVLSFVRDKKIDLVVLGRSGAGLKRRVEKLILGGVSRKVVENCPCSVLVVH